MSKGWIKLNREITEHWVFDDPLLFKIWIDLLLSANHKPNKIEINGEILNLRTGQFWTSIRKLSDRWNISKDTTMRKLKTLQKDNMIFIDSRRGIGTLITVLNYADYQGFSGGASDTDKDTGKDKVRTSFGQGLAINNNDKNDNNEKNEKNLRASFGWGIRE